MNFGELLLPPDDPSGAQDSFRFGTVTSTGNFKVQIDGDSAPISATPTRLVEVGTGDRVFCQFHGRQLLIVGRVGGFGAMRRLEPTNNLNSLIDSGIYHQSLNNSATYSKNYPIDEAGMLEVFNASNVVSDGNSAYIYQRYTHYRGVGTWVRTNYGGTWNPWRNVSRIAGWVRVFGSDNSVEAWASESNPRVIEINGNIYFNGAMKTRGTATSGKLGQLPTWAIPPPEMYDINVLCQGSFDSAWLLKVVSSGAVTYDRMTVSQPRAGLWLPFHTSWPSTGAGA